MWLLIRKVSTYVNQQVAKEAPHHLASDILLEGMILLSVRSLDDGSVYVVEG